MICIEERPHQASSRWAHRTPAPTGQPEDRNRNSVVEPVLCWQSAFSTDQELMVAVVDGEVIQGGAIAVGDELVVVRAIGVDAELRGRGIRR